LEKGYSPEMIGSLAVARFDTSHDAAEPCGYTFREKGHRMAYVTDTGYISDVMKQAMEGSEVLVLEANHDVVMLKNGRYAPPLKKRILGVRGHLSNDAAGSFLAGLQSPPREVFLAHLSQENNDPGIALSTVEGIMRQKLSRVKTAFFVTEQNKMIKNSGWEDYHEQNIFE